MYTIVDQETNELVRDFNLDVVHFNKIYKLTELTWFPSSGEPTLEQKESFLARLQAFRKILRQEVDELDDVIEMQASGAVPQIKVLTALADFLGDIIVYATSEADRWNIPINYVLLLIMNSNFSKLDADGNPLYDQETGKVLKGPNFQPPEAKIEANLLEMLGVLENNRKLYALEQAAKEAGKMPAINAPVEAPKIENLH